MPAGSLDRCRAGAGRVATDLTPPAGSVAWSTSRHPETRLPRPPDPQGCFPRIKAEVSRPPRTRLGQNVFLMIFSFFSSRGEEAKSPYDRCHVPHLSCHGRFSDPKPRSEGTSPRCPQQGRGWNPGLPPPLISSPTSTEVNFSGITEKEHPPQLRGPARVALGRSAVPPCPAGKHSPQVRIQAPLPTLLSPPLSYDTAGRGWASPKRGGGGAPNPVRTWSICEAKEVCRQSGDSPAWPWSKL